MTDSERQLERMAQYVQTEATGRSLRSFYGPVMDSQVEYSAIENPAWNSMQHASDTLFRALSAANAAGLDGRKIVNISLTGCTQYGNITIGWDLE